MVECYCYACDKAVEEQVVDVRGGREIIGCYECGSWRTARGWGLTE